MPCRRRSAGIRPATPRRSRPVGPPSWIGTPSRAMLIATVPGDEASVAAALRAHPSRFVGAFMFNPAAPDATSRLDAAFDASLTTVCLFPAMHRYSLDEPFVDAVFQAAARRGRAVFVHCGFLSVGLRNETGAAEPVRHSPRRPAGGRGARGSSSRRDGRDSAFRRRVLSRDADGRRSGAEHRARLVQFESLDPVPSRVDAAGRLRSDPRLCRPPPPAVRHRLVLFPAGLAPRHFRGATRRPVGPRVRGGGAGRHLWW